jgi:hypothetical protein
MLKLEIPLTEGMGAMVKRLRLFSHTVTNRTGQYHTSSKTYSRKLCLKTMLAMEPSLTRIFVKCGGNAFEHAYLSKKDRFRKQVWRFYINEKVDEVTLNAAELNALGVHQDVEEIR